MLAAQPNPTELRTCEAMLSGEVLIDTDYFEISFINDKTLAKILMFETLPMILHSWVR